MNAELLHITGTFIDEISHDIPHQNWSRKEWDEDFRHMKAIGIDTVIMIRGGYRKFITWPSEYLIKNHQCYRPGEDVLEMLLTLADQHQMNFYFGLYDSGKYWDTNDMSHEIDVNRFVIDEVWAKYGHHPSFKGWYLSMEISRKTKGAIESIYTLGKQCKEVSNNLPTFISPWIDGKKAVMAAQSGLTKEESISIKEHEEEWSEIFSGIHSVVDAVAFQDGHIDYDQLDEFFGVNKQLADQFGMKCWTNAETFDRDMPIKFLPIKFEKLRLKLEAAKRMKYDKAITFEFSHFMSPQSAYPQAGHLYNRYREWVEEIWV
jgi:Domain of unknown function (DUF4434)/Domain of unknown function (DUF5109)